MNIVSINDGRFGIAGNCTGAEIDLFIKALRILDGYCPECGRILEYEADIWDDKEQCYKRIVVAGNCAWCGFRGGKMKIEIKNRFSGEVIVCGEYENIRECVVKNVKTGADLTGADLRGAYLTGADLRGADLRGAYLTGADLSGADLTGADLTGAYLSGAYLTGADLTGIKNYSENHYIFNEIVCKQSIKSFTEKEWAMIGKIMNKLLCWDSIKKECGKPMMKVFKELSKLGWDEYEIKYREYNE